jgi:hypothetical protein
MSSYEFLLAQPIELIINYANFYFHSIYSISENLFIISPPRLKKMDFSIFLHFK